MQQQEGSGLTVFHTGISIFTGLIFKFLFIISTFSVCVHVCKCVKVESLKVSKLDLENTPRIVSSGVVVVFSGILSYAGHPLDSCSLCPEGKGRRNVLYLRAPYLCKKS